MVVATTLKQLPPLSGNMNERLDALLKGLNDVIGALTNNLSAPITLAGALAIAEGAILPDTYTPTKTLVANLDDATMYANLYVRVGDLVAVFGQAAADATAAGNTLTKLGLSLPIASDLAALSVYGGGQMNTGTTMYVIDILADATNNRAELQWYSGETTNQGLRYWYMYQII